MPLSRLFSTFPRGVTGFGILLLRLTIGSAVILQGQLYLSEYQAPFDKACLLATTALLLGLALGLGFLTRAAAMFVALGAIGIECCVQPSILIATTSLSLAMIGPGGFSLDARLFGFREIVIPRAQRSK